VIGCLDSCCDRLFVQVWCMVDALVHGTCLVQVGAWLMHLFMVQVDYRLRYRLVHGLCTCLWYRLITG
jgi:hypothetical protein